MANENNEVTDDPGDVQRCDCGYRSRSGTLEERIRDAQGHALQAHGIEVTPVQVLAKGEGGLA